MRRLNSKAIVSNPYLPVTEGKVISVVTFITCYSEESYVCTLLNILI